MINTIYNGDSLEVLKTFPSEFVDTVITSPPYYGLRNYAVDGQLGQESSVNLYLDRLCEIFSECRRVLKPEGTLWVNLGDSYGGTGSKGKYRDPKYKNGRNGQVVSLTANLKPKSLLGIPERFVIKMDDLGWYHRNTIIWTKPNVMPSSVKDRFTIDFEYFYFFSKSPNYYFEQQLEPLKLPKAKSINATNKHNGYGNPTYSGFKYDASKYKGRNKRTTWNIPTQIYSKSHFATFPEKLVITPILACCPEGGIVLDPFIGSGTTARVCKLNNRNWIGIELNPDYINLAYERINAPIKSS